MSVTGECLNRCVARKNIFPYARRVIKIIGKTLLVRRAVTNSDQDAAIGWLTRRRTVV